MGVYEKRSGQYVKVVGGGGIPVPPTAEPGQVIRVSAVDEDGRPVAWDAVKLDGTGLEIADAELRVAKGHYELAARITIEEPTTEVILTETADGTPFYYDAVQILTDIQPAAEPNGIINVNTQKGQTIATGSGFVHTSRKCGQIKIWNDCGRFSGLTSIASNTQWEISNAYLLAPGRSTFDSEIITKLRMVTTVPMPAGSIIEVWGVRAQNP